MHMQIITLTGSSITGGSSSIIFSALVTMFITQPLSKSLVGESSITGATTG